MGVKCGLLHQGNSLEQSGWGKYLHPWRRKWREDGEDCI